MPFRLDIKFKISKKGEKTLYAPRVKKAFQEALGFCAQAWHTMILPKHFKYSANAEYHYKKRCWSYMKNKGKKFHHQYPLVWTGNTRNLMLGSMSYKATPNQVTMRVSAPAYFSYTGGNKPDMKNEVKRFSAADMKMLRTWFANKVVSILSGNPMTRSEMNFVNASPKR